MACPCVALLILYLKIMTEIWKPILNYENFYLASSAGRIRSLERNIKHYRGGKSLYKGKIFERSSASKHGYIYVPLHKDGINKQFSVHRLIAQTFIPNPDNKPYINHKNGIKTDNRIENLEWCTASENNKHAFKIGLKNQVGSNHNRSKLTEKQVRVIKHCINLGMRNCEIAKYFPVVASNIGMIRNHKGWNHVII